MERKAVFKSKIRDKNGYAVHMFYEYRGHEYMITNENNGYSEPLWVKHKNEQDRIDAIIEHEQKQGKEWKYEGSADEGFDVFMEYVNGGIK